MLEAFVAAFAIPKSTSFTSPSKEMRMFCGLTSRWTISIGRPRSSFLRWAYSRAAQTWLTTRRLRSSGMRRPFSRARFWIVRRSRPCTYSMAM